MSSNPIPIMHLADIHFGMENHGSLNPRTGMHSRLEDFSRSLNQAITAAIEEPVDLVVFAGDAYKRNAPSPTEQREFVKAFCRLADAKIPTVMISGNHDIPVMHGKAASIDIFRTLRPGFFHVYINRPTFGDANPPLILETPNGPIAVCAFPYFSPSYLLAYDEFKGLSYEELQARYESFFLEVIKGMPKQVPDDIPRILVAHLTVYGATLGGYRGTTIKSDDVQVLPANLVSAGYDYVALGHIHKYQNLSPNDTIPVVYPGSIDRVDFGERDEDKGYIIAKVSRGKSTYRFESLPVRDCIQIRVEPDEGEDLTEAILAGIAAQPIDDAIVRVTFVASDADVTTLDMKRIHEALRPAHYKAGFVRIPKETSSTRRTTTMNSEVKLRDALLAYIAGHEDLKADTDALLEKARRIEETVTGS